MNSRGLLLLPLLIFSLLFVSPKSSFAKSGCCSSHSGVNCAAGPQADGRVICNDGWRGSSCLYSEMVMCGGSSYTTQTAATPTPIPVWTPTPTPVFVATPIPTVTSTPTPTPTSEPTATPEPEVKSAFAQAPSPTPKPLTAGGTILSLGFIAAIIGIPAWLIYRLVKKFRRKL